MMADELKCLSCAKVLKADASQSDAQESTSCSFASCSSVSRLSACCAHSEGPSSYMSVVASLSDLIKGDHCAIDRPLCQSCADHLTDLLDQSLLKAEEDCREYRRVLSRLGTSEHAFSTEALTSELAGLLAEEDSLKQELLDIGNLDKELDEQILREQENVNAVVDKENQLWKTYRDCRRKIQEFDLEIQSAKNQLAYTNCMLEKLSKTDVFNLTFHIWHSGPFGVINGFRLGRLPGVPVDWPEINAAFGQSLLLLYSLIKKVQMELKGYQLVPFGSYSYLQSLRDGKELRLFADGGAKFTWYPKLDQAVVAFLDCLHQLEEHIRLKEAGDYHFPHRMSDDKLDDGGHDYSVKTHLNSEERWTKAMKCLLTNLKWALAWVASVG